MNGFYILVFIASLVAIVITYCLGKFFKSRPAIKYIPAVVSALSGIGFYIKSRFFSKGFEDIGYIVLTLIACIVFLLSPITAYIIGLVQKKNRSSC